MEVELHIEILNIKIPTKLLELAINFILVEVVFLGSLSDSKLQK